MIRRGQVTGIVITNPGTGYTTATASLLNGGYTTAATLGTVSLTANTSGGLKDRHRYLDAERREHLHGRHGNQKRDAGIGRRGNDRLPTGTTVTLGDGTTNDSGILKLDSRSQTIAGLLTPGSGTGNRVVNGNATAATLSVNGVSGSNAFGGILGGPGSNENDFGLREKPATARWDALRREQLRRWDHRQSGHAGVEEQRLDIGQCWWDGCHGGQRGDAPGQQLRCESTERSDPEQRHSGCGEQQRERRLGELLPDRQRIGYRDFLSERRIALRATSVTFDVARGGTLNVGGVLHNGD